MHSGAAFERRYWSCLRGVDLENNIVLWNYIVESVFMYRGRTVGQCGWNMSWNHATSYSRTDGDCFNACTAWSTVLGRWRSLITRRDVTIASGELWEFSCCVVTPNVTCRSEMVFRRRYRDRKLTASQQKSRSLTTKCLLRGQNAILINDAYERIVFQQY